MSRPAGESANPWQRILGRGSLLGWQWERSPVTLGFVFAMLGGAMGIYSFGFACGVLVCRQSQPINLTIPGYGHGIHPEPLDQLRGTLRKIELQLRKHGRRLTSDTRSLSDAGLPAGQSKVLNRLIKSNRAFKSKLRNWADDVRRTSDRINGSVTHEPRLVARKTSASKNPGAMPLSRMPVRGSSRNESRRPFQCSQWMAPYNGCRAPVAEEFVRVQCRDISSAGISFFLDHAPKYEMVVIRLEGAEALKYLTARIEEVIECEDGQPGRYAVDCQLLGTLHPDTLAPEVDELIRSRESETLGMAYFDR